MSCNTISLVRSAGDENGFISFSISTLTTAEDSNGLYTSVNIPFTRDGGTSGLVAATFKVSYLQLHEIMRLFDSHS